MGTIDWAVLAVYVLVVIGIGIYANRRQTDTEAYFVGGRNLPWWAVGLSIIATSFSAASILGVPGYAYQGDMWYLQYQIGDFTAAGIVCVLFIPFFHRIRLTSAYEYLEKRFDLKTRLLGSTLFILTVLFRAGSLLYGASLLFSEVAPSGILPGNLPPVEEAIIIFGIVAIIYTIAGGISAVIWTDVVQFGIMSAGIIGCVCVAVHSSGDGFIEVISTASQSGKLQVFHFDSERPLMFKGIITAVFGYGLLALSLFGTNQQPVQRYMSVKSPSEARKSLLLGVGSGAFGVSLSLLFGVFLYVFYSQHPGLLPEGVLADKVVPIFIRTQAPQVLTGLLVAAVFAAAMSSLDSALNSLSTAATVDFYSRLTNGNLDEKKKLKFAKLIVLIAGIVAVYIGILASREETSLIDLILKFMGYFAGGILGMFLLGILCPRANGTGAFWGALLSTGFVLTMSKSPPFYIPELHSYLGIGPIPFIWFTAVSLPITMILGYLFSLAGAKPSPGKLEDLTCKW